MKVNFKLYKREHKREQDVLRFMELMTETPVQPSGYRQRLGAAERPFKRAKIKDYFEKYSARAKKAYPGEFIFEIDEATLSGSWRIDFFGYGKVIEVAGFFDLDGADSLARVVETFRQISFEFAMDYGLMMTERERDAKHQVEPPEQRLIDGVLKTTSTGSYDGLNIKWGLHGLGFYNVFGPVAIDFFGEKKLLSCPAYKVEKNGKCIFIQLYSDPERWQEEEATWNRALDHLGREAFFDKKRQGQKITTEHLIVLP